MRLSLVVKACLLAALITLLLGLSSLGSLADRGGRTGAGSPAPGGFVAGEVLVKFKPGVSAAVAHRALPAQVTAVSDAVLPLGVKRLAVPPGREGATIDALRDNPLVEYAEPDYIARAVGVPDDPLWGYQWNMNKIDAPQAWDITTGWTTTTIAIVDTGINGTHEDLTGKVTAGYDFIRDVPLAPNANSDDYSPYYHGTHVAGIAGAQTDNGLGVAGVAWGAQLMPVKVLDSSGNGTYSGVANGIIWAVDHGAPILNISLGGDYDSLTLHDAVRYAYQQGTVQVAAAGNNLSSSQELYPGAYTETIAVSATDGGDNYVYPSTLKDYIDVAAPGVWVYSTQGNGYGYLSGTSMATPHVSGLAALVWSVFPTYTHTQVQEHIERTADDLGEPGWDQRYGWGRINAYRAVCNPPMALSSDPHTFISLADATTDPFPASHTLYVSNSGCGALAWTAVVSPSTTTWLTLTPPAGTVSSASPDTVEMSVSKSGLGGYGTYRAQVVVTADRALYGSPQTVDVTLIYVPALSRNYLPLVMKAYEGEMYWPGWR